jgi:hypothetical protein
LIFIWLDFREKIAINVNFDSKSAEKTSIQKWPKIYIIGQRRDDSIGLMRGFKIEFFRIL